MDPVPEGHARRRRGQNPRAVTPRDRAADSGKKKPVAALASGARHGASSLHNVAAEPAPGRSCLVAFRQVSWLAGQPVGRCLPRIRRRGRPPRPLHPSGCPRSLPRVSGARDRRRRSQSPGGRGFSPLSRNRYASNWPATYTTLRGRGEAARVTIRPWPPPSATASPPSDDGPTERRPWSSGSTAVSVQRIARPRACIGARRLLG